MSFAPLLPPQTFRATDRHRITHQSFCFVVVVVIAVVVVVIVCLLLLVLLLTWKVNFTIRL